ncbi:MAG: hypothetical protein QOI06_2419 [Nocardioidaceae bacterium]|jgi:ABC-type multidrug transport system fused ATPase/permease subunit|nr:hypothetical protein [Nocardioidaceae bacterium]
MTYAPDEAWEASGLPRLWSGTRRRHLSLLVLSGLGQAAAAGIGARLLSAVLSGSAASTSRGLVFALLVVAALSIGLLRMVEKVLAERLSQEYVHEVRLGLIRRNLADGQVKSLGIAVARTTNDLTSVKNWVSQGVAPLAVGIPLILGASAALIWLEPMFAIALVVPIGILLAAMATLAPIAYTRARKLRSERGKLSSQVADTILSTNAIRSAGGTDRELRRIESFSSNLVTAAVHRARTAGALRGAAAATSGVASAMVVGIGLMAGLPTHTIAGALAVVGFLATPIHDLGRVAEYRQTYRAARRIIGPAMQSAPAATFGPTVRPAPVARGRNTEGVQVSNLTLPDGRTLPELSAGAGDRIVVDAGDKRLTSEGLERLVGLHPAHSPDVMVAGRDMTQASPKEMRALVGYAAQGMMLVRGSVSRTVRYRCPEATVADADNTLATVGLVERVAELPDGIDTRLVHGGEPLTIPERARLLLARAILNEPPLLVLDNVDADLGRAGREMLRNLLDGYPGVVILASDDPDQIVRTTLVWAPADPAAPARAGFVSAGLVAAAGPPRDRAPSSDNQVERVLADHIGHFG